VQQSKPAFFVGFFVTFVSAGVLPPPPYWWLGYGSPNKYLETGFWGKNRPGTFTSDKKNPKIEKLPKNFYSF